MSDADEEYRKALEAAHAVLKKASYSKDEDSEYWSDLILEAFRAAGEFDCSTDIVSIVGSAYYCASHSMDISESSPTSVGGAIMFAFARIAMMIGLSEQIASLAEDDGLWGTSDDAHYIWKCVKRRRAQEKSREKKWNRALAERNASIARTLANNSSLNSKAYATLRLNKSKYSS